MPEMNGIDFCHALHWLAPELKVILATGSDAITEAEARLHGFSCLLRKPSTLATISTAIEQFKAESAF